jgi:hypothetical protein
MCGSNPIELEYRDIFLQSYSLKMLVDGFHLHAYDDYM